MLAASLSREKSRTKGMRIRRVGVIDVGSNSVRLVVHDVRGRAMNQRFNEKVLAGLGKGMGETGRLSPEGVELALKSLQRFYAITEAQECDEVYAFATAAVRDAADRTEFCDRVHAETRQTLKVLSGDEEARAAAHGVLAGTPHVDGIVGDLGGSSLELAHLREGNFVRGETYPAGPLALDTSGNYSEKRVRSAAKAVLSNASPMVKNQSIFVAVGGAWRAIANIHMEITNAPLRIMQNYEMDVSELRGFLKEISGGKKHSEAILAVAKRRAATLPLAAVVLDELLAMGSFTKVVMSSYGVREGIVFDTMTEVERLRDPLDAGLEAIVASDSHGAIFGQALSRWVTEAAAHTLPVRLSSAACRLVDIGALLHPDHRADLAFDLVARAPLPGLTHMDRASLALAIATRYKRNISNPVCDALLDGETASRARALGAVMRLGANLSGRSASLLRHSTLKCDGEKLELSLKKSHAHLASETVHRRLQQAAAELGMESCLTI